MRNPDPTSRGLVIDQLCVDYGRSRVVHDFTAATSRGRTLGLVGESGSGKSTVAKSIVGLLRVSAGSITLDGRSLQLRKRADRKWVSRRVQMVFQDPGSALNPRACVAELLEEPLIVHGHGDAATRRSTIATLLDQVRLPATAAAKYPSEFSGGQKQRIAVARALAVRPEYLVLDEVTSALDVSVQAVVLELLLELQEQLGLGYLFISHDLAVVKKMSDEVCVMRHGRIVEHNTAASIFAAPGHEYTRELIAAVPSLPRRRPSDGDQPSE